MSKITRSQTGVWLLGQPAANFPCNVLPKIVDMLQKYHHHRQILKETVSESRNAAIDALLVVLLCKSLVRNFLSYLLWLPR